LPIPAQILTVKTTCNRLFRIKKPYFFALINQVPQNN
jgi:hypothetical protein